jgi:hypothetical protein
MQAGTLKLAGATVALAALVAGCSDSATNTSDVSSAPKLAALAAPGELRVCKYTVKQDDVNIPTADNLDWGTTTSGTFTATKVSGGGNLAAAFAGGASVTLTFPTDNNCATVWTGSEDAVISVTETPTTGSGLAFYRIWSTVNGGSIDNFQVDGIKTTPTTVEIAVGGTVGKEIWFKNMPYTPTTSGCTLTIGYWQTHSKYGPAPKTDPVWDLVQPSGADSPFFLSGKTWYQAINTAPQGNAYYILARQFIGASLNLLSGDSSTPAVDAAIAGAKAWFETKTPSATLTQAQRQQLIAWATTLDNYNNGLIGPGHCSDEASR